MKTMEWKDENESSPEFCPWCGSKDISRADDYSLKSDEGDYFVATEYQCQYCGASFWC